MPTVIETGLVQPQLHILKQRPTRSQVEWLMGRRERPGLRDPRDRLVEILVLLSGCGGSDQDVAWHTALGIRQAGGGTVDRTHHGTGRVPASHHVVGGRPMAADAMPVRSNNRHPVRQASEPGKRPAKSDTWQRGRNLACDTANLGGCLHVRVKCFELRRAPLQVQEHDRTVTQYRAHIGGTCSHRQHAGERESSNSRRPDGKKVPPAGLRSCMRINSQHL